jgi:hypothetical protein
MVVVEAGGSEFLEQYVDGEEGDAVAASHAAGESLTGDSSPGLQGSGCAGE